MGTFSVRVGMAAVMAVVLTLAAPAQAAGFRTLILTNDTGATVPQVALQDSGRFSAVDVVELGSTLPTLPTLDSYDSVLAYTTSAPTDADALGDLLGDFLNLGGKIVVLAGGALVDGTAIGGSIASLSPLGAGAATTSTGMLSVEISDIIFTDVDVPAVSFPTAAASVTEALGGSVLARDTGATPLALIGLALVPTAGDPSLLYAFNTDPRLTATGPSDEYYELLSGALTGGAGPVAFIPEPSTWAMMILGFALVTLRLRQRRFA